jgi:DNA polymerase III subunit epsilon
VSFITKWDLLKNRLYWQVINTCFVQRMKVDLKKPIVFFDLETTGVNVSADRIVEIALIKINTDSSREEFHRLVNPTMPIPVHVSEIHGIYDIDVKDKPTFKEIVEEVAAFIGESDLAGYNCLKFDVPLLAEEFMRAEFPIDLLNRDIIDVQNIYHKMEPRTLSAAVQFYCDKNLDNAHSALADTRATLDVFIAQLDKYETLANKVEELSDFSRFGPKSADFANRIIFNEKGQEVFNFGKHKGKTVEEVFKVEPGYYSWMMNGEFPLYTKQVIKRIKERMTN